MGTMSNNWMQHWLQPDETWTQSMSHLMHQPQLRGLSKHLWQPWFSKEIVHIVMAGGQATAPNAELMALEMGIATAVAAGCSSLVCFTDSTTVMNNVLDPSPHSGQVSSLAACTTLCRWLMEDHQW